MTKVNFFAGFDVSKKFFDVCLLSQEGVISGKQLLQQKEGFTNVIEWLPIGTHCVMEATGPYYLRLACWLHQHGFTVSVINPLVIRRFTQTKLSRAKTDKADARLIALYGQTEQPQAWQPPAQYIINLQQLDAVAEQLVKQQTAWGNQLESFTTTGMIDAQLKRFLKSRIYQTQRQLKQIEQKVDKLIMDYHHNML